MATLVAQGGIFSIYERAGGTVTTYTEYIRPTAAVKLFEFQDGPSVETWTLLPWPETFIRLGAFLQTH